MDWIGAAEHQKHLNPQGHMQPDDPEHIIKWKLLRVW